MVSLHEPAHTFGSVAKATGGNPNTIRGWFKREGLLELTGTDVPSPGTRMARRLSGNTALAVAIMVALVPRGVDPAIAAKAAMAFAHVGSSGERLPGQLFKGGMTVLLIAGDGARVIRADTTTPYVAVFTESPDHSDEAVISLRLDTLVTRVRKNLGIEEDS